MAVLVVQAEGTVEILDEATTEERVRELLNQRWRENGQPVTANELERHYVVPAGSDDTTQMWIAGSEVFVRTTSRQMRQASKS